MSPISRATLASGGGSPHDHPEYAETVHTHPFDPHSHADNEIPASIARDTEVTAAIATHAATPHGGDHPHPYASDTHNHDAAYSGTAHTHDPAVPAAHSHADADLPAGLARDSEVAAAYSPLGHSHSYAAPSHSHTEGDLPSTLATDTEVASAVTNHANAADPHPTYLTAAEGNAAYATAGHTHAGGGNDARITTIYKSVDQAVTGTVVVDVTGMSFAVEANSSYVFSMWVDITASAGTSPTHNYQFTGPAGIVRFMAKRTQMTSATAQATTVVTALATGFGAGAVVANIKHIFEGTIVTGVTAGTVQLRVTPGGTVPTSTIARGSGGFATKVG